LIKSQRKLSERITKFVAGCVMLGLKSFHQKNIAYMSLKPEKVLFDSEGYFYLSDFGYARFLSRYENDYTIKNSTTPEYIGKNVDY